MSQNDYPTADARIPTEGGGRRRGNPFRGPGRWVLLGIAIALLIGAGAIAAISQTAWGREQVLGFTLGALGGRLNGELTVDHLEGNLIAGARLYDVGLVDTEGQPLVEADSVYIQYRLATFLGGDIVINRLAVYNADVNIFRMPGDTLWNYQKVLQDPTPSPTAGPPTATLIERMFLHDAHVEIRAPMEGDPRLSPERREEELQLALADTARYMIEEVPGGYLQTNLIDVRDGEVAELFIGPDERGGIYLEVVDGDADIRIWRDPPLEVRGATLEMHLTQGVLSYSASRIELPNSRGESRGQVDMTGDRPLYDLVITAPEFALSDLRWLYPWLPENPAAGSGSAKLWVEDREDGLLVAARDLDLKMPDTHVVGDFGLITNVESESIRFVNVDLEADPLRAESVEQLLPEDLPVEGLVIGGAEISG